MEVIAPYPDAFILPEGSTLSCYAAEQQELYDPLPSIKIPDGRVVAQFKPTQEELAKLFEGEPITLVLHTFNQPLQPIQLFVGGADLTP